MSKIFELEAEVEKRRADLIKAENDLTLAIFREHSKATQGISIEVTTEKQLYSISVEEHNFGKILEIVMTQGKV